MKTRKFGATGLEPSILGFGMMRLKRKEDNTIDEEWAIRTLRSAIDRGLSYVDTAYTYADSERVTGLCLQDGYREKVTLASKLPTQLLTCEEDFEKLLDEELERLQTDHIDMYLLHAMNRKRWENYVLKYNVLEHMERAKAAGKIRHIGFSFHDSLDIFEMILNSYDHWDFCQIQLNYMDTDYQAGLRGLEMAHAKGLAVVVMEPMRGGKLANVPEQVAKHLPFSPVESALDFLWNREEVNVVLSGMNEWEQVEQNLSYADRAEAGMLTDEQLASYAKAAEEMRTYLSIPCTSCHYCDCCPREIAIPEIFAISNKLQVDGDLHSAEAEYKELSYHRADACVHCHACEAQCPQQIEIVDLLAQLHKRLRGY